MRKWLLHLTGSNLRLMIAFSCIWPHDRDAPLPQLCSTAPRYVLFRYRLLTWTRL